MFDLDKEIAAWSSSLAHRCGRADVVAELEDHLRTDIDHLVAEGVPLDRAFELAVTRLGSTANLDAEYEKNRSVVQRLLSRLARWDAMVMKGGVAGHSVIFASVIVAIAIILAAIILADSDTVITDVASYLIIVAAPLWLLTRRVFSRR